MRVRRQLDAVQVDMAGQIDVGQRHVGIEARHLDRYRAAALLILHSDMDVVAVLAIAGIIDVDIGMTGCEAREGQCGEDQADAHGDAPLPAGYHAVLH